MGIGATIGSTIFKIFAVLLIVVLYVGGVAGGIYCGFSWYDVATSYSATYGTVIDSDPYEDFDLYSYNLDDIVFTHNGEARTFSQVYNVSYSFDGVANDYNVLINDTPANKVVSTYGSLTATYDLLFYGVYGSIVGDVELEINLDVYVSRVYLTVSTLADDTNYGYLLEYIHTKGFELRIVQAGYAKDITRDTSTPGDVVYPLDYICDANGNLLHYIGNSTSVSLPATYSLGAYVENFVLWEGDGLSNSQWQAFSPEDKADYVMYAWASILNFSIYSTVYSNWLEELYTDLDYKPSMYNAYDVDVVSSDGVINIILTVDYYECLTGNDYTLTSISSSAFSRNTGGDAIDSAVVYNTNNVNTVIIPASVTSIGDYAFAGMYNLVDVILTGSSQLESIGAGAFYGTGIVEFTAPDSVISIGRVAFTACDNLQVLGLGSITTLNGWTVSSNTLSTITIPDTCTSISAEAIVCRNPNGITIYMDSSVTSIASSAFVSNAGYTIVIPTAELTTMKARFPTYATYMIAG